MTTLDKMRKHIGALKWILAIVCLAFVVFYIPDFLRSNADAASGAVATVNGQPITTAQFRRSYQAQIASYRAAYGSKINEQVLRQLGIDQQILQELVNERAAVDEAQHLGLSVSDNEVRDAIAAMPAFQENGRFIGEARYVALLKMQQPPLTPTQFETSVRDSLIVQKLQNAVTSWITVPESAVEEAYHQQNDKVKLDVVTIPIDKYLGHVKATDADIQAYYDAHKTRYRVGQKRRVKYILVDVGALQSKISIPASAIESYYNDNIQLYSTPEEIRVRHILFRTNGKNDAAVKAEAEKVLKMAKAGANFADLAKKYSQDKATAALGGDLGYFQRGKMVPAFDQAAFALKPGQISGLVKTQYGYHIIKMVGRKPATTKPLASVQTAISQQLAAQKAQAQAADEIQKLANQVTSPSDMAKAAAAVGLTVQQSDYFRPGEPILGLGSSPQASDEAFALNPGQVSGPVQVDNGFAIMALDGTQAPYIPKLSAVKSRVKQDVLQEQATALARQAAVALRAKLEKARDFDKVVKAAGFDPKPTDLVSRSTPLPDIGISRPVETAAFSIPIGSLSDPITTGNGIVILKVLARQIPTPAEFAKVRAKMQSQMLSQRRTQFFAAYMAKAKQGMRILVNREALQQAIGS